MASGGDGGSDRLLVKIAIFGITMSIMATSMIVWFTSGSSDYDYDTINGYRNDLIEFAGASMVSETPWVLTGVYTPYIPADDASDILNHLDPDGWVYGESITDYAYLGEAANIKLDKGQVSNQLLTYGDPTKYEFKNGKTWWNGGNDFGIVVLNADFVKNAVNFFGGDISDDFGYEMASVTVNNWNYTGYRYTFDPTLPFSNGTSSKDGTLSIVWYDTGEDTGISGGLEVYGAKGKNQVLLAHYSVVDIINSYQSTGGYAQIYDFDFEGIHLNLSIRFDPNVYSNYPSLNEAWGDGAWSMAISSPSAGNFFDVENSNAFDMTAGSMFDTFIDIYTFSYPGFNNDPWYDVIMWLLIGLPMSLAMLCLTLRLVGGVFKIF